MAAEIDAIALRFGPNSLTALNVVLGLVMFGVALELRVEDFKEAWRKPLAPGVGLLAQFLVMPALTFALVWLLDPAPSIALGMLLVAACPGGNISNFLTSWGKGNTALSVSITAISTTLAIVMTPLNVSFWGALHPKTAPLLKTLALDPVDMLGTVVILLGVPLLLGMLTRAKVPAWADRLQRPFKWFSLLSFAAIVVIAFRSNFDYFIQFIGLVFLPVLLQNALALTTGWSAGWAARLGPADRRALAVEVGIQNSGLGLVLIFNFFGGLGGMAVIAAWWGIWHIIAGLTLTTIWARYFPIDSPAGAAPDPST